MRFEANSPIWLQVMICLETDILTGKLPPGAKLPGGRDLALEYEINPNTAARVYQELEKTGLCETRRGMGTYVTEDRSRVEALRSEMARKALEQFLARMETLGISRAEAAEMIMERDG